MEQERLEKLEELEYIAQHYREHLPAEHSIVLQIYSLNNYFVPHLYENFAGCGSCQTRVKNRAILFWDTHGAKELIEYKNTLIEPNIIEEENNQINTEENEN